MRELHIGQRVRTPQGDGVVMSSIGRDGDPPVGYCVGFAHRRFWQDFDAKSVEPLPPDVRRQQVADLLAAVEKRIPQCEAEESLWETDYRLPLASSELSEVAEALRLMLGGES